MRWQRMWAAGLVCSLAGCASTEPPEPSTVAVSAQIIQLPAGGQFINDNKGIKLKPGLYRFVRREAGYRDNSQEVMVEAGKSFFIDLAPGVGYAQVDIRSEPTSAVIELAGQTYTLPLQRELDVGTYQATISAEGYRPLSVDIEVQAGKPVVLNYQLKPQPTHGTVRIRTTPEASSITLNNNIYTPASLPTILPFGDYQLSAIHQLAADKRLVGRQNFSLHSEQPLPLALALNTEQWRVNGQWLDKADAKRQLAAIAAHAEQQRVEAEQAAIAAELAVYQQHRIAKPYQIEFTQPPTAPNIPTQLLADKLHEILQIGDRLLINTEQGPVLIWKRSPELTAAFSSAVAAWQQQQAYSVAFADDPVDSLTFTPGDHLLPSLAYQRYRFANSHPLLDAGRAQLPATGIQLGRAMAQGKIRLLAIGGQQLRVNDSDSQQTEGLLLAELAADNAPLAITWQSPPQQLLVASQHELSLPMPNLSQQLKQAEKQDFNLPMADIARIDVYTRLPDASWQHKSLQPTHVAGEVVPVSQSELGPHLLPGEYLRVWQVHYRQQGQLLSRQFSHQYRVTDEVQDGRSQHFLRRDN